MSLKSPASSAKMPGMGTMVLLLVGVLVFLFYGVFLPGHTLFSNDGPLGKLMSACHQLPARFSGCWQDLNSEGYREEAATPCLSFGLLFLLGPLVFSKLYAFLALFWLGLGAWCCFRQLGLAPIPSIIGGLATMLNSSFFSAACWGVASHPITIGLSFFAIAALAKTTSKFRWLRVIVAGSAVGVAVIEGSDIGAIFSLTVAAFLAWQSCVATEGPKLKTVALGALRLALVAICAAVVATQAISELVQTNIEGIAGTQQDTQTRTERWDWATQWSLPKVETLGLVVPGLFGYLLTTPDGGNYWGRTGRNAAWDRYVAAGQVGNPPTTLKRFSGGGAYLGVGVALIALWAMLQALRRKDSVFPPLQRKWLWFWGGACVISILLAFGRFAPFYRMLYSLPYFSTIRNPTKFLHVFSFGTVMIFTYGVDALWRRYMHPAVPGTQVRWAGFGNWWKRASNFDKRWVWGCLVVLGVSVIAWVIYASSTEWLERYLDRVQMDADRIHKVAQFSVQQPVWFVLFFILSGGLLTLILSGAFANAHARKTGMMLLGLVLVLDLARANLPFITFWDYHLKYSTNPVIDGFRDEPNRHRVAILPFTSNQDSKTLDNIYRNQWVQHQFPYYNIQSIDIVQLPRKPRDLAAYERAFSPTNAASGLNILSRRWQLTNTRYLLGLTGIQNYLNTTVDPEHHSFRIIDRFNITPIPGVMHPTKFEEITAIRDPNGACAVYEFAAALPRTRLYSHWEVMTNYDEALKRLADPNFHPSQAVVVPKTLSIQPAAPGENGEPGTVSFVSYAPKDIVLQTHATAASVLLLNDRYDPHWKVTVDGKPSEVFRCNYLMRGVALTAGAHTVEFMFRPPFRSLYVSVAAIAVALGLVAMLLFLEYRDGRTVPEAAPHPRHRAEEPKPAKEESVQSRNGKPATKPGEAVPASGNKPKRGKR